jgi:hypothetical protein
MARDVYSREVAFGGAFSADGARVTFGDEFSAGMLVQNINYQYTQNITRLYELGGPDIYLVAGRTQGQASVARIIGPRRLAVAFYTKFGNVCNAGENILRFSARTGCAEGASDADGGQDIVLRQVVLSNIGGSVSANDMIINESLAFMFLILEVTAK